MEQACAACGGQLVGGKFCPHCGAPVQSAPTADPLVGAELGAYRVLKPLAEGGMGKIYIGEQTSLGRKVCIKTLRPDDLGDQKVIARFEREARAVSALRHPNVAQVYDFGRQGSWFYLVMELVEGRTLRALMDQDAPVPLERACTLMTQILSALEEAHAGGIIHRDLKPENVLVARLRDGSDLAKVVDFGIARVIDAEYREGHLTGTGLVCGTPGYMSPEQITGDTLDARADVYAAGVVLFELLTGKAPFAAPNLAELLRLHLTCDPPRPSRVTSLPIPEAVDELLVRALAREKDARLPSALEFKRAVEALRPSTQTQQAPAMSPAAAPGPTCAACGTANAAGMKFCGGCGAALSADATGGLAALTKVLPGSLVAHLKDLPPALSGERRHVTVVTGALTGLDDAMTSAETARQLTTRCLNGLVEAASRAEGTVEQLIGDAVVVLFGAPRVHEDDPERAVRCALDMQAFVTQLGAALKRPLGLRVGVALGEVVTGQGKVDSAALAPLVQQAQALAQAGTTGRVQVSATVKRATAHAIRFRPLPREAGAEERFEVEGLGAPVEHHPLVGREEEVSRVGQLLAQVRGGRPGGVLFLADAGLGKSRLLEEVAAKARAAGLAVAHTRPRRRGLAQLEVLRDLFLSLVEDAAPGEDVDVRLRRLEKRGAQSADVKRLTALLGTGAEAAGHDADERRRLDLAAVTQAFLDVARKSGGLCVVVDDAHLADTSSLAFLSELISQASSAPLAVVASARPVAVAGLERLPQRTLKPLGGAELRQILEQQLRGPLPDELVRTVVERAEGSPFLARELTRTLVDTGALTMQGGVWRATRTQAEVTVPMSVAQLFQARFDGLSAPARQLLRCGALAGRVFPLELVAAALGARAQDLQAAVTECTRKGFLEHAEAPGCLAFKAELFQESVRAGVPEADARALHKALGEALEKGLPSGDAHPAEAMARHFEAAGQRRKASTYFSAAAERLVHRNAFAAATDSYLKAIRLVERDLVASGVTDAGAWGHYLELAAKAAAAQAVVSPPAALALVEEALAKAPAELPARLKGECQRQRGSLLLKLGRPAEAEAALQEALTALEKDASPETRASLEVEVSAAREARGDFGAATLLLVDCLKRVAGKKLVDRDLLWRTLNQLGRLHLKTGQAAKAKEFFENAVAQARQVRSTVGETRALANLAGALGAGGDAAGAEKLFLDALALARGAHDRIDVARIEFNLGKLAASQGKTADARTRLETALALAGQVGWREGVAAATQALNALPSRAVSRGQG
ncbi:MAG: protein kinase [Myxococcota bacterium]